MKRRQLRVLQYATLLCCAARSGLAADRVRAGEWEMTAEVNGRMISRSTCMSGSDAAAINGDEASLRAYAERASVPAGCTVSDVKIDGDRVIVTSVCAGDKQHIGTTTYHGDALETVNSNGTTARSKWVGPCKVDAPSTTGPPAGGR